MVRAERDCSNKNVSTSKENNVESREKGGYGGLEGGCVQDGGLREVAAE